MKKTLLFISFALFSGGNVIAQTQTDTLKATKIRVYSPSSDNYDSDNAYKWVIKTDVFAFLTGEFALAAEYRISRKFSVEGSAGVTYPFIDNGFSLFGEEESYTSDAQSALGSAFRGTIKYYPSSDYDAIEGWSFGIQLYNKVTNQEYDYSAAYTTNNYTDKKVKTGASLIISKQLFQDSNIAFEYFIGIGMANTSREYYQYVDYYTEASTIEKVTTDKVAPNFQLGFKIGFGN